MQNHVCSLKLGICKSYKLLCLFLCNQVSGEELNMNIAEGGNTSYREESDSDEVKKKTCAVYKLIESS